MPIAGLPGRATRTTDPWRSVSDRVPRPAFIAYVVARFRDLLLARRASTVDEAWIAELLRATIPICEAVPPHRHRLAGIIQGLRIDPGEQLSSVEARISDGTGQIVARWLGWSSIGHLRVGEELVVEGELDFDHDGRLVMLEPDYQIVTFRGASV